MTFLVFAQSSIFRALLDNLTRAKDELCTDWNKVTDSKHVFFILLLFHRFSYCLINLTR